MRKTVLVLVLAGCGGAPDPYPLPDLEARDARFVRPSAPTSDLLAKEELSLEDLLALADALHPALAAERREIDSAQAAVWEARLLPNPTLLLEIEDYRFEDGATTGKMERTAGFSIPLPITGRLGRAGSRAEAERDAAALRYLARRREILSDVKRARIRLLSARRTAELAREGRELARRGLEVARQRVQAQAAPELEVLKASVALAKAEIEVGGADRDAAAALKDLHAAIGDADFPRERFSGVLAEGYALPSAEALRGQLLSLHPRLAEAAKRKEAAELEKSVAEAERFADPELTLSAGLDGEDEAILEGGLAIPLPLFNANSARIAGAEARARRAVHEGDAVRLELLRRLDGARRALAAAAERAAVYRHEILPQAGKALEQTREGYRLGRFGVLEPLDAQRTLADARIAAQAATADLNLAAADLEELTGTTLEPR